MSNIKNAAIIIKKLSAFGSSDLPMGKIFALAKYYTGIEIKEIEKLLKHTSHAARVAAVSIMDFEARDAKVTSARKKQLFNLYIDNHSYIDTWDLVDRAAPYVVGGYLFEKPRAVLYKLAKSKAAMERRTAIVATYYFIRQDDLDDTFKIAELLVDDTNDLVQKAVGSWVREAGKKDSMKLIAFLDAYAATMPRTMLRYAIEKLPRDKREYYLKLKGIITK